MIDELEQLKTLLWKEWDPIGVNDMEDAKDEYDSYAFQIFVMLNEGRAEEDVMSYLNWLETDHIGLGLSGKNEKIVDRIFEIHRSGR
ncbi:MAG: hypothetical protein ABL928_07195 [Sphingorhabdus sp.]